MNSALINTYALNPEDGRQWSLPESIDFCKRLARSHYENFIVGSVLLPARLREHFYPIYAYCRISDDLGDEAGDPQSALQLLSGWEAELDECYRGRPRHPVFVALRKTIDAFDIPKEPFANLLHAFRQDQTKTRYETYGELLEYCRFSANPVGRLVLYLFGYRDPERQSLSDSICTGLQLANHWQDIALDYQRLNRIYLPQEDMRRFGYAEPDLAAQTCDRRFISLLQLEVDRARECFHKGAALVKMVDSRAAFDVDLFARSGLEVLRRIESAGYDVFRHRPVIGKGTRLRLMMQAWLSPGKMAGS